MKKFIILIFTFVFLSNNVLADDNYLNEFNKWLLDNGHTQYVNFEHKAGCKKLIQKHGLKVPKVGLFDEPKVKTNEWFWLECHKFQGTSNLKIKFYKSNEIPEFSKPNKDTALYYLYRGQEVEKANDRAGSTKSDNPYKFKISLRSDDDKTLKKVRKAMNKTSMLSYLLYEDGKITIDEITPLDRFGILYDNNTVHTSASVGKSFVSYVTGHAICEGYISSIDHKLNDWELLENTLFYDQKLINLLNMAAGHQKYADKDLKTNKYRKNANANTVEFHLQKGVFKDSKKVKSKYQYTNFITNLLINYVWFKSEGQFQNLLDEIFIDKAKVKNDVWFLKMNDRTIKSNNRNNKILKEYKVRDEDGPLRYSFRASIYDYLRIAKAMLDDWQNDTCVGKYLKNIHERRIPKNDKWKEDKSPGLNPKSYAGQFYADYSGMRGRNIMGMVGKGGQSIMIDFDKGRINVINTIHIDYNWKKIAHSVIKKGK